MENSDLDMVVAGSDKAVLMVESDANELSEDLMIGAILYAHQEMKPVIEAIKDFANEVLPEKAFSGKTSFAKSFIASITGFIS